MNELNVIICEYIPIWIQSSMHFGRTNNKGMICLHIMLWSVIFLIVLLPVCQKKHWYDVCTHIGMMLVAYNE